jgi:hypothetical protein
VIASILTTPKRIAALLILTALLFGLFGCEYLPFGYTPIKEIVNNPARFENKQVKIKGIVSDVTKLPFVEVNFYALNDEGYEIIVSPRGTVPGLHEKVTVLGVVENVAIYGGESIGLHVKETRRVSYPF